MHIGGILILQYHHHCRALLLFTAQGGEVIDMQLRKGHHAAGVQPVRVRNRDFIMR